jgi:hypothetical protein
MKKITFWLFALFTCWHITAQTTITIGAGTVSASGTNGTPIYRSSASSTFNFSQSVQLLTAADLAAAGITAGSTITKLAFYKNDTNTLATGRSATLNLFMKNSTASSLVTTNNFTTWTTGSTNVFTNTSIQPAFFPTTAGWVEFTFTTPFVYTGGSIETAVDWSVNTGTGSASTGSFAWMYSTVTNAQAVGTSDSVAITGALSTSQTRIYNTQLTFTNSPCTGTPAPGNTNVSPSAICFGSSATLGLQNPTLGSGVTYQWYLNGTAISGATSSNYVVSSVSSTGSYYCNVTCSGVTTASTALSVGPSILNAPLLEPYNTFLPNCWLNMFGGDLTTGPTATTGSGWGDDGIANSATTGAIRNNIFTTGANDWIVSPVINIPVSGYELKFDAAAVQYAATTAPTNAWGSDDSIEVLVSTGGGLTNWTPLFTYNDTNQPGITATPKILDLDAYAGQNVRFAFRAVEGTTAGPADIDFSIDNFQIRLTPTCIEPLNIVYANIASTTANISWDAPATAPAVGYEYVVSTTNTPPTVAGTATTNTFASVSGLTPNAAQYVFVRSICSTTDASPWVGPVTFTTLCSNVTAFTQNFDGVTASSLPSGMPACWIKVGTLGSCYTSTSTPVGSAPNVIYFFGTSTSAPTMRMQPVSNLGAGTHRMKFKMRSSSATTLPSVDLGYLTNPYDATTFVSLTSIASTATTMVEYVYAPPAGTYSDYPAIKMNGTVYGTVYLDDFVWEAIPTCTDPSALVSANVTSSSVDISWDAPNPAPALGYQYVISTSNTPPTAAGTSVTTTFAQVTTGLLPTTQYYVFVRSICSTTDASPWAGPITFTTACAPITTLPHVEPFATFLPSVCWLRGDNGDLTAGPATFGTNSWKNDGFSNNGTTGSIAYNHFTTGANDWIISPQFTIPATGWELKFDAALTQWNGTTAPTTAWDADDRVEVLVASNLTNWTVLHTYNNANAPAATGTPNIIDLDAYNGQTVRFAYRVVSGATDGSDDTDFFVDNFEIRLTPACPQPTNLVVSGITATGAATSWDAMSGAASGYEYVVSTSATPPTGAGTAITTAFVALTGLTPQTPYYLYVRANCGSGSFSVWSVQTFTTQCAPVTTLPWTEGFESVTTPAFPPCWFEQNGDYATSDATFDNTPKSGTKYLRDSWSATNEYMWTPGFQLTAGTSYDFSSWIQGDGGIGWVVDYFVNSSQVSTGATQLGATYNVPGTGTLAIQPYAKITRTFVPTTSGVYYFAFRVNQPNSAPNYVAFDDVELKVTPNIIPTCATGITATPNTTCGNFANQLSWNNVTDATGYYVTIGTTSGGTNIANAVSVSSNSYSFSGTINTQYFWKVVPFSGAGSATGCTEQSFTTVATGCYCASVPTTNDGSGITNATVGTTPFVIADVTYVNNTTTAIAVEPGTNTNVQLVFATGYTYDINIWIDFNNDFDFNDAGELVKTGIACTAANPNTVDASFLMPVTAPTGPHRMRIGTADSGQVPPAPCYSGDWGVTLDFTVDTTLGSNSFDTSNFVAYPNPVKDVLNLSYKTAISNVKVINLLGQEVVNAKANTNDVQVDMSALNAGVYIVNVTVDDTIHSIKVIKE